MDSTDRLDGAIRAAKAEADRAEVRPGRREFGPLHVVRVELRGDHYDMFNAAGEKVRELRSTR